jgi:hypothetical protein
MDGTDLPDGPKPKRLGGAPIGWTELAGVLLLVFLADVTVYRGHGFAGYSLLFAVSPALFWLSSTRRSGGAATWVTFGMLLALAAKLVWCGNAPLVAMGFTLIVAYTMALSGYRPFVLEAVAYAAQSLQAGLMAIIHIARRLSGSGVGAIRIPWLSFILPALAFFVFGCIFVLANPDLADSFGEGMRNLITNIQNWLESFSPDLLEIGFWVVTIWLSLGLLRPVFTSSTPDDARDEYEATLASPAVEAAVYAPYRNTLLTVILLFAAYLVFEFRTLWFREFPKGFHYSGYAHEGAAWLTVALAIATLMLSFFAEPCYAIRYCIVAASGMGLVLRTSFLRQPSITDCSSSVSTG